MRDVSFCTSLFSDPRTRAYSHRALSCLLWALVYAGESDLRFHPELPDLYSSGVRWQREVPTEQSGCGGPGQEKFLGPREVVAQGWADCEDLASWRVAELRVGRGTKRRGPPPKRGHPPALVCPVPFPADDVVVRKHPGAVAARPAFYWRQRKPDSWIYHIVVAWPDGYLEDPSRKMGMGGFA